MRFLELLDQPARSTQHQRGIEVGLRGDLQHHLSTDAGAVIIVAATTDSASTGRRAGGTGNSSRPWAATWWRTLATAAAPRPQLSHSARPARRG